MATTVFNAADVFDFNLLPHPGSGFTSSAAVTSTDGFVSYYHPKAGLIKVKNIALPHIQLMDMRWYTAEDIQVYDDSTSDAIRINFKLDGHLHTRFNGLKHPLDMRPQKHNLVYVPDGGDVNTVRGNQFISLLHVSLDTDFFAAAIGQDDTWSEWVLEELGRRRPFAATSAPQSITPAMRHLIDDIRNCKASGPMRNLLIQSRVLELVALQIDQFKTPRPSNEAIRPDEVEKLSQLKAYLDANFLTELSLAQLSRHCLLNEFKVKKGFKQLFGTTVFNYVRKLRMEYASLLLKNSRLTVDEIADRLGYEHAQHFSIAFKKYTGLTPSQYQRGKAAPVALNTTAPLVLI